MWTTGMDFWIVAKDHDAQQEGAAFAAWSVAVGFEGGEHPVHEIVHLLATSGIEHGEGVVLLRQPRR